MLCILIYTDICIYGENPPLGRVFLERLSQNESQPAKKMVWRLE